MSLSGQGRVLAGIDPHSADEGSLNPSTLAAVDKSVAQWRPRIDSGGVQHEKIGRQSRSEIAGANPERSRSLRRSKVIGGGRIKRASVESCYLL